MITKWYSHLRTEEDKELFARKVLGAADVLERLNIILTEEERQLDRSEMDVKAYDQPNWDFRQAHKNGYRSCISFMKKLINMDPNNDPRLTGRPSPTDPNI